METVSASHTETDSNTERQERDRVMREQMGEVVMDMNRALVRAIRKRQGNVDTEMGEVSENQES